MIQAIINRLTRRRPAAQKPQQPQEGTIIDMTRKDLRMALARLGWEKNDFAKYIGKSRMTVHRWINGKTRIDPCAERVLELVLERGTIPSEGIKRRHRPALS